MSEGETYFIESFEGVKIFFTTGEGFHGGNGPDNFGYHDTLDEIRDEIRDYWQGTEHGELNGFFRGDEP